ncbi:hypothetical protein KKH23_09170 [Patescibacteria group bacterium]|nr:hypothetical protein [Patescibacteria group bacterium]
MDNLFPIYVLNLAVVIGMFLVTVYRAWIEKKQMKAQQRIEVIETILEREKDMIKDLSGEEFIEMLETILR